MAQKTIVHLTDDLDGSEATHTVESGELVPPVRLAAQAQ